MSIDWSRAGLRATSKSTEVAAYLERLIVLGTIAPGEKVPPEREIAQRLGVSRTSVRQAMHELTLKGLTSRRPGRGTVVIGPGVGTGALLSTLSQAEREPMQVTDLRQVVEPSIAGRAAERATPADVRQLEHVLSRAGPACTRTESIDLDEQFHLLVAHATQNPLLVALVEQIKEWLGEVRRESHATAAGRGASLTGHQRILDAIRAGDAAGAEKAMLDHISGIGRFVQQRSGHEVRWPADPA